eukprot:CAMPEP_0170543004 /NCGR_PEP_ID=MMETSP0211-20121228/2262_1 /TAXON_ID=311385 /ORGANISM="Pseudokeronopsis sp., Strain OXSARD2" /LENGTH=199 /DNA_ID=CAMNT_0010846259 /DNA_START=95 /DNA_END=694 /DNA_ORIENTATION=+
MCLELPHHFTLLQTNSLDFIVAGTNEDCLGVFVESYRESYGATNVDLANLLDHADVPDLADAIRVAAGDELAPNRECTVIDAIQVAIESLHSESGPHVPNGDCFVCRTTHKEVGEGLEGKTIDRVGMTSVLLPHLQCIQIVQFDGSVSPSREDEVTSVMELNFPDGLGVDVLEGMGDGRVHKVPNLNALISSRGNQVRA